MKPNELAVCGLAAVRALFAKDAAAIKRLFFDYPTGRKIGVMCKVLAGSRRVYRCVEPAELEKIAGTVHHGGIVAVIDQRLLRPPRPEDLRRWAHGREPLLLLDRIGNPHNLGAIVRTAAFFGVGRIVIPDDPEQALPGDATYRIAEGGMEHVAFFCVPSLAEFIREVRPFYEVVGAAVRGAAPLARDARPPTQNFAGREARPPARPIALVLGNEERGLAADVAAACERRVMIPGGGAVESLNVAAAAAILIHHFFGRGGPAPAMAKPVQ
jgi:TrmH RNA methyltransferase